MKTATQDGSFVRPHLNAFEECRSESIDYAVMEHHSNVAVLPFVGAWSDVGSWKTLSQLAEPDESNNKIKGSVRW
jgi:mannose-1-phosphate guanylyltransferase/mannose-6-phosphate isomerase